MLLLLVRLVFVLERRCAVLAATDHLHAECRLVRIALRSLISVLLIKLLVPLGRHCVRDLIAGTRVAAVIRPLGL